MQYQSMGRFIPKKVLFCKQGIKKGDVRYIVKTSRNSQEQKLPNSSKTDRFETNILIHLDAAFNLARWLMRHGPDAEDVVQEACLRAFKYFDSFHANDGKAWLLTIVRNTCYSRFQQNKLQPMTSTLEEESGEAHFQQVSAREDPEEILSKLQDVQYLNRAIAALPIEFREVLILRELEDLPYKTIADIASIPIGTVMSRLSRARALLRQQFIENGIQS